MIGKRVLKKIIGLSAAVACAGTPMLSEANEPIGQPVVAIGQGGASSPNNRIAAYSPAFAKRFAFVEPQIPLPNNGSLQAVEIRVPPDPVRSRWCDAKLYVDSALPIELPSHDRSGSHEVTNLREHFFLADDTGSKRWLQMTEADRRHFSRYQMSIYQLAAVVTPDYRPGAQGALSGAPYRAFLREMFPGITYLHLGFPCQWITDFGTKYPAMQIWLKRAGGPDYGDPRIAGAMQSKDFIQVDIPNELIRKAKASVTAK